MSTNPHSISVISDWSLAVNEFTDESQRVLVILPALNEELTISSTIAEVRKHIPQATIVVIDNGSSDGTEDEAKSSGATVLLEPRRGKGFAVQKGFDYALSRDFSAIALLDADATYSAEALPVAIDLVQSGTIDMVVGTRIPNREASHPDTGVHFRFGHKLGNHFFSWIATKLLPTGITDVLSGWRVMSKAFYSSFPGGAQGFEIEAQLNSHAYNLRAAIQNIPVDYFPRPKGSISKLNTYRDGIRILRTTLRNFRRDRPLYAFSVLATPWLLVTLWFVYLPLQSYIETGLVPYLPRLIAGVGSFLIASLLWASGMLLERIRDLRTQMMLNQYHASRQF